MKTNLNQLAAELATQDNPDRRNEDVIAAKTILAKLGQKLRSLPTAEAQAIIHAIVTRAGKKNVARAVCVLVFVTLAALAGSGCAARVPTTKIALPGGYTAEFPKQFSADALQLDILTNGTVHFAATNIQAFNEPNVIVAQGQADAAKISAMGSAVSGVVATFGTNVIPQAINAAGKTVVPKP